MLAHSSVLRPLAKQIVKAAGPVAGTILARFVSSVPVKLETDRYLVQELNGKQCKTYLVADKVSKRAALIDALRDYMDKYLAILGYHQFKLDYLIETHSHADHFTGMEALSFFTGAKIAMSTYAPSPHAHVRLDHGTVLPIGDMKLQTLATPGHTGDSLSFYTPEAKVVFSGDTLLVGGSGRTDFAGGSPEQSYDSITKILFALPDETVVCPGHDYRGNTSSTIGIEKATNPRVAGKTKEQYVELMTNLGLPLPEKIMEALQVNIGAVDDKSENIPQYTALASVLQMPAEALKNTMDHKLEDVLVVDVREPFEYNEVDDIAARYNGMHIPVKKIIANLSKLEPHKGKRIVCVCRSGVRSSTAAAMLKGMGYPNVYNLTGGIISWGKLINKA